ncbi:Oryzin [Ascochyta rabiei]|uniref:Serine-type endopeptidase n=1 Tax=Didymella rabiei TaxID=5454 RepID=A0A163K8A9_DIDRA|nr:Oryzin [Ascochyta rabiei]KZM26839.1 serine-type endopeptidase [Ascochyta rabiei]UPX20550.1 Oryzin [Ascochyta rabiei]
MQFFAREVALVAAATPFLTIPGKYNVQLKPDTDVTSIAAHHNVIREIHARDIAKRDTVAEEEAGVEREYGFGDFKGYAGAFDAATVEELKSLPEVLKVVEEYIMTTSALVTQNNAPWGLDSISSRTRGASSYIYDNTGGRGTFSYVVDTGIRTTHIEFGGRAQVGFKAVGGNNNDKQGHGTHVAGTVGGNTRSPARSPEVLCVGNVQSTDARYGGSTGSNFGPTVGVFAAGTGIVTAYFSDTSTATLTGTLMTSPHVAGLFSYLRGLEGLSSAAAIKAWVLELATPNRVTDTQGSANRLAYNGNGRLREVRG